jgi:hypothetical protein
MGRAAPTAAKRVSYDMESGAAETAKVLRDRHKLPGVNRLPGL